MATPTSPDKPPPQWMLLLEKKKNRPHRLAHEIGAGAPCLTCGEKCPGLDLHFWRKVCRNCKCKKEEHDVQDDDGYEQFEILLGAGNRRKKPGAVLKIKVPDVDVAVSKKQFDWVPPNVSDDVAAEYMQQLPASKLPISGSDGALYRRQQLEKQMPLHDLDAAHCHNLTPQEIEQLQKYLDNLKNNVVGQGRVTKIPGLYLEQRHWSGAPHTDQVSSTSLPSSRSEQSLHPLPPLPHLYNAVPRPFKPTVSDDGQPPPLPDSLPPGDLEGFRLRTPGSFNPSGQRPYGGSLSSSRQAEDLAFSQGKGQNPEYSEAFGAHGGSTVPSQFSSSIANSSKVPGSFYPGQGHMSKQTGSNAQYPTDGSTIYSKGQLDVANSSSVPGRFVPGGPTPLSANQYSGFSSDGSAIGNSGQVAGKNHPGLMPGKDGSVIHSHGQSGITNSSAVGGQFYPGQLQSSGQYGNSQGSAALLHGKPIGAHSSGMPGEFLQGQGQFSNLPGDFANAQYPSEGSVNFARGQTNIANSSGVGGKFYPGNSTQSNNASKPFNPSDGSAIHSQSHPNIVNSSEVGGKFYPGENNNQGQLGNVSNTLNPLDASVIRSHGQSEIPHSSGVGQFYGGQNQNYGRSQEVNPHSGSTNISQGQSNIANSTGVGGKFYPGQNLNDGQSGNAPNIHSSDRPNVGNSSAMTGQFPPGLALREHTYSNVTFPNDRTSILPPDEFHSSNPSIDSAPGDYQQGNNNPSNQIDPMQMTGAAGNPMVGGNENWRHPQHLEPARFEHSSVPSGLASSSEVGSDSMPRSAQIIQQSNVVDNELASKLQLLSAQEQAAGSGLQCRRCLDSLAVGEVAVFADRAGPNAAWHPACFACRKCSELLADLVYFFGRGDVYCGRHYAELLDIPRCRACDELIFVKEYTVAEGMTFHVKHFSCYECDEPLAGKQYVPVDEMPTCLDCYQEIFGKRCATCNLQIPAGQQRVGWKELNWHMSPDCFRCSSCLNSLLGAKFVMQEQKPYCNKECASNSTY